MWTSKWLTPLNMFFGRKTVNSFAQLLQVFMCVKAKIIVIESIQTILRRDNNQLENKGSCYIVTSQVQLSLWWLKDVFLDCSVNA